MSPLQSASVLPARLLLLVDGKKSLRDLVFCRFNTRSPAMKSSTVRSFMKRDNTFVIDMITGLFCLAS